MRLIDSGHSVDRMALISCPECESQVSDKAPTCPNCGVPIHRASKVMVYGYTQQFLVNPKVEVYWAGELVGKVKKGDFLEFDISEDGDVEFRTKPRRASLPVRAGNVTRSRSLGTG